MDNCSKKFIVKPDIGLLKGDKGDPGAPGTPASFLFPLSSDNIDYRGVSLTQVLDDLTYLELSILAFTGTTTYEKGQILTSLGVTWSYNKAITTGSQTITGVAVTSPVLNIADRAATVVLNNVNANTSIILTADDVLADTKIAKTATLNLTFLNKLYYGKKVTGTINSAFVLSLPSSSLQANRIKDFNSVPGNAEYIWFALPIAYGVPTIIAGGFVGGFQLEATIQLFNDFGYEETYAVYRSVNANLGSTDIQVI